MEEPGRRVEVVQEAKVKMVTLPHAGHLVTVSYEPGRREKVEVLMPPGREADTVTERTKELPYEDWRMPHASEGEVPHLREPLRPQAEGTDPLLEKFKQLGELRDSGVLTEAEFEAQKARLLAGGEPCLGGGRVHPSPRRGHAEVSAHGAVFYVENQQGATDLVHISTA